MLLSLAPSACRRLVYLLLHAAALFAVVALHASALCAQSGLAIAFDNKGLSSLKYNGVEFLSYGDLRLDQVAFGTSIGSAVFGSTSSTVTVDAARQTQTRAYNWGSIVVAYAVTAANRLSLTVTVNNTSSTPIQEIWFETFGLHFPSAVQNYNGAVPIIANSLGQPAAVNMNYSGGVLAVADDNVTMPLQLGFPWSFDPPANSIFPLSVNTGTVSSYPNQYPVINRPIAAGGSDQYQYSLRFGPAGSTLTSLAPDVYQSFAAAFPPTVRWPDRRPIGQLILATAAAQYPTNPRGWFLDPTVDVTTPAGLANFSQRVLSFANTSIGILKSMNAQGMITWDIEGQQYPDPISYICDPTVFATTAPEMAAVADQYFQSFINAGLRVGVCIRPQQFSLSPGGSPQQTFVADPTQLLIAKTTYAHSRWGATLFYIDSNVNLTNPNPIDPNIIKTLSTMFPDSLFIPEHSNMQYYAYSAPYLELRQGYTSTPPETRFTYPATFTNIYTADGPLSQDFSLLVTAVRQGDSLLYRSWYSDPQNQQVLSIYQAAGLPATISVAVMPAAGSLTAGQTQQFTATVTGSANQQVTWSITPLGVGSISAGGLYTAPSTIASQQTVSVIATSVADPAKSAGAAVTLNPAVAISVSPATKSLTAGQTQQFTATVTGSTNQQVTWSINPPGVGSISAGGLYAAPSTITSQQTASVIATSVADPAKTATASVSLAAAPVTSCGGPSVNAFTGCYYQDRSFGVLGFSRVDPQINFNWGSSILGPGVGPDNFTVRWQGNFTFPAASYAFTLATDDGSRLYIDGQLTIDNWGEHPAIPVTQTVALTAGTHLVQVDYEQLGGGASASLTWTPSGTVGVTLTPSTVTLMAAQVQQFSATVTGSTNQRVTWSIAPPMAGSISPSGLYTAPSIVTAQQPVTVTATSVADPSKSASAGVTLNPGVAITVNPPSSALTAGQTQQFTATVTGSTNQQVTWSINPPGVGSISPGGLYTAPSTIASPQTITVIATSLADPTRSASASVSLAAAPVTSCGGPSVNAFTGCYYQDRSFGVLGFSRVDPQINFNWSTNGAGAGVGPDNFSVRWQGNFTFSAGNYLFTLATDDGSRLFIDGQLTIDNFSEHPAIPVSQNVSLTAGTHLIQVDYFQLGGAASASLAWSHN